MTDQEKSEKESEENNRKKAISSIKKNYQQMEESIVSQLYMANDLHGNTTGAFREDVWKQLFEMILPKKFVIEHSVFIIDSNGNISKEVDLAIMDETYTPYIFRNGRLKFIPIEAVAAVIECKSKACNEDKLKEWVERIIYLRTSDRSVARLATGISVECPLTQKSTRPIRILCCLRESIKDDIKKNFDFVIKASEENSNERKNYLDIEITNELMSLEKWNEQLNFNGTEINEKLSILPSAPERKTAFTSASLNNYVVKDNALLTLNFQLNQLLMLINNPILFPHRAYVDMFNNKENEDGE